MKNPLVDALRQAQQQDGSPDSATAETATPPDDEAGLSAAFDVSELELEENVGLEPIEPVVDSRLPAVNDETGDEQPMSATSRLTRTVRRRFTAGQPERRLVAGRFERLSRWVPLVVLFAGALAAMVTVTIGHIAGRDLVAARHSTASGDETAEVGTGSSGSRFPLLTSATAARDETNTPATMSGHEVVQAAERKPLPPGPIAHEPQPAGMTNVNEQTFGSLEAAYQAYLAGDLGRAAIDAIFRAYARRGDDETVTEIKLLLQRYPREPLLHAALGTALAARERMPEARNAFARADELDQHVTQAALP